MALRANGRLKPVPVQWFAGQSVALPAVGVSTDTTDDADVLAGAVDPVAAGTSASTDGADGLAASVGPVIAASSASVDGADIAAGQVGPVVAASAARTDGVDALAAAVSALVDARSAVTDAADVLASTAAPVVAVSSVPTEGADAAAATLATVIDLRSTTTDGADLLAAAATAGATTTEIVLVPYRIPRMSDITTVWNVALSRGDWSQAGASLQSGADVVTAVLISLFTDRVANSDDAIPDGTTDPRGWWADDPQRPIGSRLWLLSREKQLDSVPQRANDYCKEALQWMLDDGVVLKFDISSVWVRTSLLGVQVTAYQPGGSVSQVKFSAAWNLRGVQFTVGETSLQ